MEYIIKNNEKPQQEIHPIDSFFNCVAATIKKFPPYYQHLAEGKIFAIVQDLEWQQLSQPSYTSPISECGTSSSTSTMPMYTALPIATPPIPTSTESMPWSM